MNTCIKKITSIIIGIALCLMLVSTTIIFQKSSYYIRGYQYITDLDHQWYLHAQVITYPLYSFSFEPRLYLKTQCTNNTICLTTQEIDHIMDVRSVLLTLYQYTVLFLFLSLIGIKMSKMCLRDVYDYIKKTCLYIGSMYALVLSIFVISWQGSFTLFHKIFFPQGNWSFPTESTLIQIFPETFWFIATIIFFSLLLIETTIIYMTVRYLQSKRK